MKIYDLSLQGDKEEVVDKHVLLYSDHLTALAEKDRQIADLQKETTRLYRENIGKDKEISALKAELERLREALTKISNSTIPIAGGYTEKLVNIAKEALKEAT